MDRPLWSVGFIFILISVGHVGCKTFEDCDNACNLRLNYFRRFQPDSVFLAGYLNYCRTECYAQVRTTVTPPPTTQTTQTTQTERTTPSTPPTQPKTTPTDTPTQPPPTTAGEECGVSDVLQSRVIGGSDVAECQYPWVVGVSLPNDWCGATILDRTRVLTAAHCLSRLRIQGFTEADVQVMVGSSFLKVLKPHAVKSITIAPYNATNRDFDAAVITLMEPLTYGRCIKPICLPELNSRPEDTLGCIVAGWGITFSPDINSPRIQPEILQAVEVDIVSNDLCGRVYNIPGIDRINGRRLCAGDYARGGKDACSGDSGGPLMCRVRTGSGTRYVQYGIVSFGSGCGDPGSPGVYARVPHSDILSFIASVPGK